MTNKKIYVKVLKLSQLTQNTILKNLKNISEKNRVCEIVIEAKRRRNRIDDSLICATSFVETAIQQLPD